MASARSLPREEQFLCSICLDAFTEPVSTPCGHNYCKACITAYWAGRDVPQCPLCNKKFRKRPQLQVNTEFRDMVEHFNNMRMREEDDICAKPREVPCDICLGPKLKAKKTCLVCLASYCKSHLEPHQRVKSLKKHQLIDPVSNLEDRVCKKHDKMFELFCCEDQTCVCFMCLKDDHESHETVPLERAFRETKVLLDYVTSEIKVMENLKFRSINEIKESVEQSKKESKKAIADIAEVFSALVVSLQRRQTELIEVIQEKQKAAEKKAEEHVTEREREIAESRRIRSKMEQLLQTEDHLHLLQTWPSIGSPTQALLFSTLFHSDQPPDLFDISPQSYVGMVKKAVAHMEKTLSKEMQTLICEIRLSDGCEADVKPDAAEESMTDDCVKDVWTPPQDKLMMIQQYDVVNVTLDPYSAHSRLRVSEDGKQLRLSEGPPSQPSLFLRRFVCKPFAIGKEGFSSGRFYYEVRVSESTEWVLGVVKEYINMQTFAWPQLEIGAYTFHSADLLYSQMPQTVGVFVDYEEGEVSFYDVDARTLIHSHTGCTFMETPLALKAFLYSFVSYTPLSSRPKLYPFFGFLEGGYGNDDNMLKITSVRRL